MTGPTTPTSTATVSGPSTGTAVPALELVAVGVRYADGDEQVDALSDVDLVVHPGELVALIGPSGSGKSSLLAVAGALLRPTTGTVRVAGEDVHTLGARDLADLRRRRLGFVFQSGGLFPALTAVEQLLLADDLRGRRGAGARERAEALLTELGLGDRLDHRPDRLSGGERQRVAIARALVGRPDLVLADEPTANLDRARSRDVVALLADRAHRDRAATLLVTHDPEGLEHADRVVELVDGRLGAADPG